MSFLTPDDFTGEFAIAQGFADDGAKLQAYIDHYELEYLLKLLGAELYDLFIAAMAAPSPDPIYEKLYDAFYFDSDTHNKPYNSEGVELMLKCFIYGHYRKQDLGIATTAGHIDVSPEAGSLSNDDRTNVFAIYNRGARTAKAIRQYIVENLDTYPAYRGIKIATSWLV